MSGIIESVHTTWHDADWSDLGGLSGRHELFHLAEGATAPTKLELRIDPEFRTISGDVFRNTKVLGDDFNENWLFSFVSETLVGYSDGFACTCTLHKDRRSGLAFDTQEPKVLLVFEIRGEFVVRAQVLAFGGHSENQPVRFDREFTPPNGGPRHFSSFRDIHLQVLYDQEEADTIAAGGKVENNRDGLIGKLIHETAIKRNGKRIYSSLNDAGVWVYPKGTKGGARENKIDSAYEPSIINIIAKLTIEGMKRDAWWFTIMLSGHSDAAEEANPHSFHVDIPYGRTLGLNGGMRRFRNRFGAIVFIGEIVEAYMKWMGIADYSDLFAKKHYDYLRDRVHFTVLHEIGHMFNLPHTWNREIYGNVDLPPNPSDKSFLSYGSKYPLGRLHDHALWAKAGQDFNKGGPKGNLKTREDYFKKAQFGRSKDMTSRHLAGAGFSDAETRHIHHAPFNRIGIGEDTFVDELRLAPEIVDIGASSKSRLYLNVDGARSRIKSKHKKGDPDHVIDSVVSRRWLGSHLEDRDQPLTGCVIIPKAIFENPEYGGDDLRKNVQFSFISGSLRLIFRPDRTYKDEFCNRIPGPEASRIHELPLLKIDRRLDPTIRDLASLDDGDGGYVTHIPLVLLNHHRDIKIPVQYTIQAVYITPLGKVIRSQPVEVRYETQHLNAGNPVAKGILGNALLPLLSEAAPFFLSNLDALAGKATNGFAFMQDDAFKGLLRQVVSPKIDNLLAKSPNELEWLADLRVRAILLANIVDPAMLGNFTGRTLFLGLEKAPQAMRHLGIFAGLLNKRAERVDDVSVLSVDLRTKNTKVIKDQLRIAMKKPEKGD